MPVSHFSFKKLCILIPFLNMKRSIIRPCVLSLMRFIVGDTSVSPGPQRTDRASSFTLVKTLVSSVDWWVGWGSRRDRLAQLMMTYQSCCFQNEAANQQHLAKTPKESYPNNIIFRFPCSHPSTGSIWP